MKITHDGAQLLLTGDFDVRSTMEVRAALRDHLDRHGHVFVDLTDVASTDLTALRLLAAASRVAEREGQRITLRGACPAVRRLLHISRLIKAVELERAAAPA